MIADACTRLSPWSSSALNSSERWVSGCPGDHGYEVENAQHAFIWYPAQRSVNKNHGPRDPGRCFEVYSHAVLHHLYLVIASYLQYEC